MTRRIITAREQHEMLLPWRRLAAENAPAAVMDLIHWTSPYRVQQIMNGGFRAGRGEAGYGVYFTPKGIDYPGRSRDPDSIPIHARFAPKKTLMIGPEKNDEGYQKYLEACWDSRDEFGEIRPDLALAKEGYDSTYYKDPWGGHQFIVHDPSRLEIVGPTTREHALGKEHTARVAASGFDPMAVTNRLKGEFHDWFDSLPEHRLDELRNIEVHPFMDHHQDNPVSHWPTVERFLKDKYPAAHRGFMCGQEDASHWLDDPDDENTSPMMEEEDEWPEPYSSADHEKLGYDPQEVAAGMVLLHNRAHSGRQDSYLNTDKKRLVDIFNKRQQMQRNYEQLRMAGFDPREVTNRLSGEFRDWADQNQHRLHPTENYPPQRDWRNIELFLKDNYPAAHKGFSKGQEQAGPMLDRPAKGRRYQTGPKTLEALGYDPREIAAGALYLHNNSHPFRMEWSNDLDRLTRIYDNRQRMQRNYEQRTGATYWHLTDNPDFRPDPAFRPENNGTLGGQFDPGLFVSQHPNHWMQSYGYWRPYVSEIDVPDEVGQDFHNSPERFITPDQYDKITVKRTIPVDAYARERYNEPGWVEDFFGHDFQSGDSLEPGVGGYHKRNWDGRYQYPGTAMDRDPEWRSGYEQKVRDFQQRTPGIIARTASERWFHVSPHDLPEGTVLTPGGGESPYPQGGGQDRVWVSPHLGWWNQVKDRGWHLYEVGPHRNPQDEGGAGWSTPAATVLTRHAASDFDDILDLLGPEPGRHTPAPRPSDPPIPGVPLGWERYVTQLSGQDPGQAHLHLPIHVLDHYREYDRDPHSDQAQALSYMLQREGVRNPVQISTDGTHALMHEGNNRLAVAKQLGITHLPVRVTYEPPGQVVRNDGTPVPLEKTLGSWLAANKDHLKPFFEGG